MVYEVTIPRAHNTSRMIQIVQSMSSRSLLTRTPPQQESCQSVRGARPRRAVSRLFGTLGSLKSDHP
jgi:hypothetical protein